MQRNGRWYHCCPKRDGHCLQGLQNITFYTFFAFGNIAGREILMHTAQLGGFEDSNGNNIPDLTSEWDKVINATGVTRH